MYKAMNQLVPEKISEMFLKHATHIKPGCQWKFYMPTSHIITEKRSLSFAGSKLWNEIPFEINFEYV